MRLHLFNARRLSDELAAGAVTPREQAAYLAVSFVAWLLPFYVGVAVSPLAKGSWFASGLFWTEFAMLVLINIVGPFYCLRQCRVAPERHYLVDLTCLYASVSVLVLTATWALFHGAIWMLLRVVKGIEEPRQAGYVLERGHDVILYVTVVGQVFLVYLLVGHYMRRTSALRA